jgi:hypothetical protein
MSSVVELAKQKYYAEGIDSLLVAFDELPLNRIQSYIAQVSAEKQKKRAHLSIVK